MAQLASVLLLTERWVVQAHPGAQKILFGIRLIIQLIVAETIVFLQVQTIVQYGSCG